MSISASVIAKIATVVLGDEKGRKVVGWVIICILSPIIVTIILICGISSSITQSNTLAIDYLFFNAPIPINISAEQKVFLQEMKEDFNYIDHNVEYFNSLAIDDLVDGVMIKVVFYILNSEKLVATAEDVEEFTKCFIDFFAKPYPLPQAYKNIEKLYSITITDEQKSAISQIYSKVTNSINNGGYYDFYSNLNLSDDPFVGANNFTPPIGNWQSCITQEFGINHTGIDFGKPQGTPIYSAFDGTVISVKYDALGYGNHLIIDHGGKYLTMYAHCDLILVTQGQKVTSGMMIAKVGMTGECTGNHLHFSVAHDGVLINPREFLK